MCAPSTCSSCSWHAMAATATSPPLMNLIARHFQPMQQHHGWGTNPYYFLAGTYGIHPTYIQEMLSDSRYAEEDLLVAIEFLRQQGGKKYNPGTLESARHFFSGEPQGGLGAECSD